VHFILKISFESQFEDRATWPHEHLEDRATWPHEHLEDRATWPHEHLEDRATWPHEHPIFLEGAEGLLLKYMSFRKQATRTRVN
jgi:hypothetical protein